MIHKKCKGNIVLDCSSIYIINSPSMTINTKGITPGPIQIDYAKKKEPTKLMCIKCGSSFGTKEEFEEEILDSCSICGEECPPSQIRVTDYVNKICDTCIERGKSNKLNPDVLKDKMLMLYGQMLSKGDNPTLLTILMKK